MQAVSSEALVAAIAAGNEVTRGTCTRCMVAEVEVDGPMARVESD